MRNFTAVLSVFIARQYDDILLRELCRPRSGIVSQWLHNITTATRFHFLTGISSNFTYIWQETVFYWEPITVYLLIFLLFSHQTSDFISLRETPVVSIIMQ